jgi:hypothetical protein
VVAGAAALAFAADPTITLGEVERRLTENALPLAGIRYGIIDAARVADGTGPQVAIVTYPGSLFGEEIVGVLAAGGRSGLDGAPTLRVGAQDLPLTPLGEGAWVATWDTTGIDHGTRTLTATATDQVGNTTTVSRMVTVINRPPPNRFTDVPRDAYFAVPVDFLALTGVTTGAAAGTEYRPSARVTRVQMAVFLWRMAGRPVAQGPSFQDVPPGSFGYDATRWLRQAGITTGVGGDRFDPASPVTRAQMVTFLHRFAGTPNPPSDHTFDDVDPVAHAFAVEAVSWAAHHGVTGGIDATRFGPAGSVTRAQMAAFLHRYARTRAAHGAQAVALGV